jgi:hypothetical protein
VEGVFLSIFLGDLLRKPIFSVWMTPEKKRLVRWTLGIPEMHFPFFNFFLRPFLAKLCLLEVTPFITQIERKLENTG